MLDLYDYGYNRPAVGGMPGGNRATLLLVPDVSEIEKIPVMPGERIWAMATNDAIIGCRTGGDMGAQTTYCKLEPYDPPRPEEYVTKADLEEILSRVLAAQQTAPAAPMKASKGGAKADG